MKDISRTFGKDDVEPHERQRRIRDVFDRVAPKYDLMNDLMSFGIHRIWKRVLAGMLDLGAGESVLDLAGGTGDVGRLAAKSRCRVIVCDPSLAMMEAGKRRRAGAAEMHWIGGTGEAIPLADGSVDAVTIAFGIRNVTHMDRALREIHRVLKPGGRFFCLEFSRPWAPIRPFYDAFSRIVIPRLGAWVAGHPSAYHYLIESIRRFPDQEDMKKRLEQAGYEGVRYRNLSMGIACIHAGMRPRDDAR